jgi:hypothetical protein
MYRMSYQRKSLIKIFSFVLCFVICSASFVFARDIEIMVQDGDLEIPLEGATVHAWDGIQFICDENGTVILDAPDDIQVVVRITYPGYENGRLLITPEETHFTAELSLGGIMESQELVIEGRSSPETNEIESGRSITISGEALSKTAEIGFIEDVMTSVKLLPGVGYAGLFDPMPSIRGGDPGDFVASYDGFYIDHPYHWGGAISIFAPKMVESVKLSHGVFSTRFGQTTAGLLDVESKKPSPTELEIDLGLSSNEASFNLSIPLNGKGGIMLLGKATYWDPFFWLAKQITSAAEIIDTAPFIRSGALSSNYRFTPNLEWYLNGFIGNDGVGVFAERNMLLEILKDEMGGGLSDAELELMLDEMFGSDFEMGLFWNNSLGFVNTGLTMNPSNSMVLQASLGAGFSNESLDIHSETETDYYYSDEFLNEHDMDDSVEDDLFYGKETYRGMDYFSVNQGGLNSHYQARVDFDWDLGKGFLFAAGVQELFSQWNQLDINESIFVPNADVILVPDDHKNTQTETSIVNDSLNSSLYALLEYVETEKNRFNAELGLRLDHMYFMGKDYSIQTAPVFNPRINVAFNLIQNKGVINDLTLTAGSGFFSAISSKITNMDGQRSIDNFELKPDRAWTSVIGTKIDFVNNYSFNIEVYYKYLFNRSYMGSLINETNMLAPTQNYFSDGVGHIFGFDLILQKYQSRYWDGWITYSFNYIQHKEPNAVNYEFANTSLYDLADYSDNEWYYPDYHRFHYVNLVLNVKPTQKMNIYTRLGFASGTPQYTTTYDVNGMVTETKLERPSFSIPIDVKFSFYFFNKKNKIQSEFYVAAENLYSIVDLVKGTSGMSSAFDFPIPMISTGFKWSY